MPPIRYFRVTETREVKVEAQDPLSGAHIAQLEFDKMEALNAPVGRATSEVKVIRLEVEEDY